MAQCPQCSRKLVELTPRCPTCQADLGLLLDYVSHLSGGLERAENLTRAGELGQAVWAYLEVLEVDPDNAAARRQVAQVATAVRQFDFTAPGRRWAQGLDPYPRKSRVESLLRIALWSAALLVIFGLGFMAGSWNADGPADDAGPGERKDPGAGKTLSGK